jgi:filamentous hemagglutinin family protein
VALPFKVSLAVVAACSLAAVVPRVAAAGNITVGGQPLPGPPYAIVPSLGTQVGTNLFHSFGQFSLSQGDLATFSGPAATKNVISRVTGGSVSSIDGTIRSTINGANLYLINPSGIVFGQNATVNVLGSFHASTADYVKMSDGTRFQAKNPDSPTSTMSAEPPVAFGFLTMPPAKIAVNGSTLGSVPGTLGLVAGPVSIGPASQTALTGAALSASGTIHVTSVAGTGEVPVDPRNTSALPVTSFGSVDISGGIRGGSTLSANGVTSGGSVFIRSGALTIDASNINANNFGSGPVGKFDVSAGTLILKNSAGFVSLALGKGGASPISITADSVLLDNRAKIQSAMGSDTSIVVTTQQLTLKNGGLIGANSSGAANVTVNVAGQLSIMGSNPSSNTGITSTGSPANIAVKAGTLSITSPGGDGAGISASGTGMPASIVVMVDGALSIDGTGVIRDPTTGVFPVVGISADANRGSTGKAGNVTVTAGTLSILNNGVIGARTFGGGDGGSVSVDVPAGQLTIDGTGGNPEVSTTGIASDANPGSTGNAGKVTVKAGTLSIFNNGEISAQTFGSGNGGEASITVAGKLTIDGISGNPGFVTGIATASPGGTGNGGDLTIRAGSLSIVNNGQIVSGTSGPGNGGSVFVTVAGETSIDSGAQITAVSGGGSGSGGNVTVASSNLTIREGGIISTQTFGPGSGGNISVTVPGGDVLVDANAGTKSTGILATASKGSTGTGGNVAISSGSLTILNGGLVSTERFGSGTTGSISVGVGQGLSIDGGPATGVTGISARSEPGSALSAGNVVVRAGALSIGGGGQISASTQGSGTGGDVAVSVTGTAALTRGGQISSETSGPGAGGRVEVTADGVLTLTDLGSGITASATPTATGTAGSVTVTGGQITIASGAEIASTTAGTGAGGSVIVTTPGALVLDGAGVGNTQIAASATGPQSGAGGPVTVAANALTVAGGARIASTTFGPGAGGDVAVTVTNGVTLAGVGPDSASGITASAEPGSSGQAGQVVLTAGGAIALSGGAKVTSSTAGAGNAGTVQVSSQGPLSLTDPGSGIIALATSIATGNAGSVAVTAPQIALMAGAEISSTTAGTGAGGSVKVTTPGVLVLDGAGVNNTEIAASATGPQSGPGGSVTVAANALTVAGGARIASTTFGPGDAGDVAVTVANGVTLSGAGPNGASAITALAQPGSSGRAGEVILTAGGAIALSGGAKATSSTAGSGKGGTVQVTAQGPLTLSDPETGIIASATSTASGDAGSVMVAASQITITAGGEIASTTAGTGSGGSVTVTTGGALVLNGSGDPNTQIAASATGRQSGPGGSVTVGADTLTVQGGARIASSTAGLGKGGDVTVTVASDIALPDPGPQITAESTGSGNAGLITVWATRLLMNNGAAISTEAVSSMASGGNITLHVRDFLHLTSSKITTSVKDEIGNGGNILIDPQLVILDRSSIIAQAVKGHGGDININAGLFIASADSIVSASSQLGISGTVEISGPRVDVNGALVVLASQLRGLVAVQREACAVRAEQPISSLVEAGRGGLPQDPEATLPALYIAGRDVNPNPPAGTDTTEANSALQTTIHLRMRCG